MEVMKYGIIQILFLDRSIFFGELNDQKNSIWMQYWKRRDKLNQILY